MSVFEPSSVQADTTQASAATKITIRIEITTSPYGPSPNTQGRYLPQQVEELQGSPKDPRHKGCQSTRIRVRRGEALVGHP
jgi:hypothetical protein